MPQHRGHSVADALKGTPSAQLRRSSARRGAPGDQAERVGQCRWGQRQIRAASAHRSLPATSKAAQYGSGSARGEANG
ncbi:hypothetical protein DZD52_06890 [Xanthomonas nasturtii]|uniref:Uncharacterized protein n=1 Tax=Xanthomonas nasturtii TaxID=1843581 RepID=A0A3E1KPK8_9XANT|nr:hypothetical protein DZD52_06890 [Xanthomonas nasturtii]